MFRLGSLNGFVVNEVESAHFIKDHISSFKGSIEMSPWRKNGWRFYDAGK